VAGGVQFVIVAAAILQYARAAVVADAKPPQVAEMVRLALLPMQ